MAESGGRSQSLGTVAARRDSFNFSDAQNSTLSDRFPRAVARLLNFRLVSDQFPISNFITPKRAWVIGSRNKARVMRRYGTGRRAVIKPPRDRNFWEDPNQRVTSFSPLLLHFFTPLSSHSSPLSGLSSVLRPLPHGSALLLKRPL